MKFNRLRISGFKSFVEPTELFIEPGLTAVVGPNGCGKSNLFDALRWVMGESRPTSVRSTEMDDVIFAGSAARPARNTAEVILYIDNEDRTATGGYNEYDAIEISRRIEREAGSVYRINGRDVRQRDVQLFFADAASGAASTAFVRQGQIGMLVSQKPLARRAILEEAAGIAGLHQRRHEAELRLRAAETNMARLDDVIAELEGQLASLKRQARQAARYRNLSGLIRKAEALALYLRWNAVMAQGAAAGDALEAAIAAVEAATAVATETSTVQANVASELPPLRQTEAEAGAALHRLIVERDALDAEEARAREAGQRLRQRITQAEQDTQRESALDADALAALEKLAEEAGTLAESSARAADLLANSEATTNELNEALAVAERRLEALTAELAEWHARKQSHERAKNVAAALAETSAEQLTAAQQRLDEAMAGAADAPDVRSAEEAAEAAQAAAQAAREALAQAQSALDAATSAEAQSRGPLENAERQVQLLSAEAKALADLLRPEGADLWPPLTDSVKVEPGYEAALGAALGDDLEAPLDEAAPHHWRELGTVELPSLPHGVTSLASHVEAPHALARRLAMTGVVSDDQGKALQSQLKPGQRLVTLRGGLWRWDGYTASADAPSPATIRLAQRNRLAALENEIEAAKETRAGIFAHYAEAKTNADNARQTLRDREQETRRAEQALSVAQEHTAKTARAAAERMSRLASLEAEIRRLGQARDAALESVAHADNALRELGDGLNLSETTATARTESSEARARAAEARVALDNLRREAVRREERLAAIAEEKSRWEARRGAAAEQIAELNRRLDEMRAELMQLDEVPAAIAHKREALLDAIAKAESRRNEAADARAEAEQRLAEADRHAKAAATALSTAREERARAQALAEAAAARLSELQTRIRDELDAAPDELAERAEIREGEELPDQEHADKRVEKLKAEREQLGGVNLRAEEEAAEHQERLNKMVADRADLDGAVQRLRRGIQSLNREGRERLIESFEKVNNNFRELFTKLFEGGEAKLTFTESEDPLEAGLEIFARPPGKKLQSLSLLSGGEQALTALALIFAVFLVNPAPVCVLDEVDAPLDDANVERFCNLLDEMTRLTSTRFLVITHHALTMSRMNRLIGVTMAERGVSQLVSVTLAEAERVAAAE
ncbi:MAG TPA: chromosome segregation protein SMC [Rhizomicrobium sp.]|nr:chromosome segregation protein SMC [Rhizomicrobium sp.]